MKFCHKSVISVVAPANATAREQFAAEEIAKYLKMIFPGLQAAVCTDAADGNMILVGGPERNSVTAKYITEAEFDREVPGPEGMMIRSFGESVLLAAGSSKNSGEYERGTLYAAYELLERFFGCSFASFFNPDYAGGEYIPVLEEAALTDINYVKACADNPYRAGILEFSAGFASVTNPHTIRHIDWMAKNRFNRIVTWTSVYDQIKSTGWLEEVARRGIMITAGHHSAPTTFLPPLGNEYFSEHYIQTHPEFYKLTETGDRLGNGIGNATEVKGAQWIFCSTNPNLIQVLADNILYWCEKNPQVDTIALWPQDFARPQCLCPECSKYTKNENYVRVFNGVAKLIAKKAPRLKMDLLAYSDLYECPEGVKLEPNIFVEAATSYVKVEGRNRRVGKPDGSALIGSLYEQRLMEWKAAGAQVGYYDYCMGVHSARQRYIPCADEMQSFWKRYMEMGIQGSGTQMEYFNFWNHIFNFYTFARTGYDTSLSMEDNLAKFCVMFGEGAPYIASAIRLAEATLDGQQPLRHSGAFLMEILDKPAMYSLCDQALAAASTGAARNNIRMYRMSLRYSDLECQYTRIEKDGLKYSPIEEIADPTGELYYMAHTFDSRFWNAEGGNAIELPVNGEDHGFQGDIWYQFEQ